ncbi:DsbA family protein [Kiloniella sp. EL199]|uniref:DsbA family protein n=1 Tax=Kiloniella sp. EL199 TaxID=2107581 RepID=UPI000EA2380B|nr:DsbA family protein [Kiloniella sp. EL199]
MFLHKKNYTVQNWTTLCKPTFAGAIALSTTIALGTVGHAQDAKDNSSLFPLKTAEQTKAFEEAVKEYLIQNPEVIIDSLTRYQELQAQREEEQKQLAIISNAEELHNSATSPYLGNPDGDVVLVEFFDYRCPYCHRAASVVKQLVQDDPNLKVVMKEFPILSPESMIAARAALAAMKQGKYNEYHFALMDNASDLSQDRLFNLAEELDLDIDQFKDDMKSPETGQEILNTRTLAQRIGANGTPAFIVGTTSVPPNTTYEQFKALIENIRAEKAS